MNPLLIQAIKKAGQVRARLKLDLFAPVDIFDVCEKLSITVRFIDVSMEGMYFNSEGAVRQEIVLSSLRPMPRRIYTCAHELGHHMFGHGSKIDGLDVEAMSSSSYDKDEYLVDSFAGAFLMPIAAIEAEFIKRQWDIQKSSSIEFYTISSYFGVGYSTLVKHSKANKLIDETHANWLLKQTPAKLLQRIMGPAVANSHFKIIDNKNNLPVIDLEVGNYLFLPSDLCIEGNHLTKLDITDHGYVFTAKHPGIVRASSVTTGASHFIRIQNRAYIGLAENRHLENKAD